MKIAVIGAGPAGFYAANALLSKFPLSCIDIIDRLPVPFGLVRYGVAPDHPSTRNITTQFSRLMQRNHDRLTFNGNIQVLFPSSSSSSSSSTTTRSTTTNNVVTFEQLQQAYNLVITATGAAYPRQLDTDQCNDNSDNIFSAHDFVLWLNGHPDLHQPNGARTDIAKQMKACLSKASDCTVIGAGNVALDIARNILRPHSLMSMMMKKKTENDSDDDTKEVHDVGISISAWNVMNGIDVNNVNVIARRAPHQAAWTTAALRELVCKVPGIQTYCNHTMLKQSIQINRNRKTKRMLDLLIEHTLDNENDTIKYYKSNDENNNKTLRLLFNHTLDHFENNISDDNTMSKNKMRVHFTNGQTIDTDMTFLSLGYVSPSPSSSTAAVGWANGTARGIIGDNKWDAETVVAGLDASTLTDASDLLPGLKGIIDDTSSTMNKDTIVSWAGWERIRAEELSRGRQFTGGLEGRSVRLESVQEMLAVANG